MPDTDAIARSLARAGEAAPEGLVATPVSGGCINRAWRLEAAGHRYFLKTNSASEIAMFEAEADGLRALADSGAVSCPQPLCLGTAGPDAFLVLTWIDLVPRTPAIDGALGHALAALHRSGTGAARFGWHRDNTIGRTRQPNAWEDDWVTFYGRHRLGHQLALAAERGRPFAKGDLLLERLPDILGGHRPPPSLVHGDLWGGNAAGAPDGRPVVFDPAAYAGDRETDLAFTRLFGGFGAAFYRAYEEAWPLPSGHEARRPLYNLYHLLNHDHLFGGSYGAQAQATIDGLVAPFA